MEAKRQAETDWHPQVNLFQLLKCVWESVDGEAIASVARKMRPGSFVVTHKSLAL